MFFLFFFTFLNVLYNASTSCMVDDVCSIIEVVEVVSAVKPSVAMNVLQL